MRGQHKILAWSTIAFALSMICAQLVSNNGLAALVSFVGGVQWGACVVMTRP